MVFRVLTPPENGAGEFSGSKKCVTPPPTEADAGRVKKSVGDVFSTRKCEFPVRKKDRVENNLRSFNVTHWLFFCGH
jgi:hypothetical protein